MNERAQQRIAVMHEVAQGALAAGEAAVLPGVSERHVWRLLAAYRRAGAAGLQHGNTGRRPAHALTAAVRVRVVALAQTTHPWRTPRRPTED